MIITGLGIVLNPNKFPNNTMDNILTIKERVLSVLSIHYHTPTAKPFGNNARSRHHL